MAGTLTQRWGFGHGLTVSSVAAVQAYMLPEEVPKVVYDTLTSLLVAPPPYSVAGSTRRAVQLLSECLQEGDAARTAPEQHATGTLQRTTCPSECRACDHGKPLYCSTGSCSCPNGRTRLRALQILPVACVCMPAAHTVQACTSSPSHVLEIHCRASAIACWWSSCAGGHLVLC